MSKILTIDVDESSDDDDINKHINKCRKHNNIDNITNNFDKFRIN